MSRQQERSECGCNDSNCAQGDVARRDFIKLAGLGTFGAAATGLPVMAGPFDDGNAKDGPIPIDKKLDAKWIASLYRRGEPTTYRGWDELKFIGMPVGGIAAGTVYLGGDGQLWCWDIFNEHHEGCIPNRLTDRTDTPRGRNVRERDGANYIKPTAEQWSPWEFLQGFVLKAGDRSWALNRNGFDDISFTGQYPVGTVKYRDPQCPVEVDLEGFTPFIPLDVERSSYPATVMQFTVRNRGSRDERVALAGFLENAVLRSHLQLAGIERLLRTNDAGFSCHARRKSATAAAATDIRDEILFADFEQESWGDWQAEGKAFAGGPFPSSELKPVQDSSGIVGDRFANTYNSRASGSLNPDDMTGRLTSPEFTIERKYINMLVGGGKRPDDVYVEVLVEGKQIAKLIGRQDNTLRGQSVDVATFEGKQAQIRVIDNGQGSWAQIAVDHIVFADEPVAESEEVEDMPDFGSLALTIAAGDATVKTGLWSIDSNTITPVAGDEQADALSASQVGGAEAEFTLAPGAEQTISFVLAWHFPNTHIRRRKRWYASRFPDAPTVADQISRNLDELARLTRLWRDTWYSGTLPHWFLERTITTAGALQTNTCYRFSDGQFWAWEGIGCCPGTCTHVWHYAQAVARLFPELERDLRERTDYGMAFRESDGYIDFRGGQAGRDATDGQAGVVLRTYREHLVSRDDAFLRRIWPQCRKAIEFLIAQDARDGEPDGITVGEQHNTLDAEWFGKLPVLASLYLAALHAGEQMAHTVGDSEAAERYRKIYDRGKSSFAKLFRDEFDYFVQEEDPEHLDAIGVGDGCYIDQVIGQWWAFNVGVGRLFDEQQTRSALHSLWDYNFCPDMGRLRESIPEPNLRGRLYALAGDAGLVMCTWPKGGKRDNWTRFWQYGYFNECMTGFEYQAAGHMVWESKWDRSLLEHGLAITRAIHDRYAATLRNPFNEIECSDHYARAMSSYGVFLAACGFEYDGPRGHLGIAPRLGTDEFSAAFTAAEGWGTVSQQRKTNQQSHQIKVAHGQLRLNSFSCELAEEQTATTVSALVDGQPVDVTHETSDGRVRIELREQLSLSPGQVLELRIGV